MCRHAQTSRTPENGQAFKEADLTGGHQTETECTREGTRYVGTVQPHGRERDFDVCGIMVLGRLN